MPAAKQAIIDAAMVHAPELLKKFLTGLPRLRDFQPGTDARDGSDRGCGSFSWEFNPAMPISPFASWMLEQEARGLLTRLGRIKPFALQESMLPAAGLLRDAEIAIEGFLTAGRRHLHALVKDALRHERQKQVRAFMQEIADRAFSNWTAKKAYSYVKALLDMSRDMGLTVDNESRLIRDGYQRALRRRIANRSPVVK
jgi:hypothetical protein